ncbi:hypothetical protein N657DRAFT_657200 [Parathielavia appendiculata]|uniref:Uncharacterized protein n=1 Tax=Parathielavia appendiculata TaxID=2587402 RepID=A0AAN6TWZ9_9PEZI|nr:hypothetical protein N657DRAFT_657200 [Parathielavia appendiculata]
MSENSLHPGIHQESGPPSYPDRILDRKIDRRALPQSFSSNLARRGFDPARKASDGSVRSMVSLFEKSAASSDHQKRSRPALAPRASEKASLSSGKRDPQHGHGCNKSDNTSPNRLQECEEQKSRLARSPCTTPSIFPSAQVGYRIEDYSLTLLKHKSYFNNRPLARCLDDVSEEDTKTNVQRVKSKEEGAKELATEDKQGRRDENAHKSKGDRDVLLPSIELDNLMSELLTWKGISDSTPKPKPELECHIRDPAEVKRFWSNVRTQLWVDDVETDGDEPSFTEDSNGKDESVEEDEVHALNPSISIGSFPSTCSQMQIPGHECAPPPMPTRPPPRIPVTPRGRAVSTTSSLSRQRSTARSLGSSPNPASDCPAWEMPPTRRPPAIPATPRGRSVSTTSSLSKQHSTAPSVESFPETARDHPAWDDSLLTPLVGLGITTPGCLDIAELSSDEEPEPELPNLPEGGRPLPIPPREPSSHSRYPSSGSSLWTRPPTWRAPSLQSSSPPPVPPLPSSIPAAPATSDQHHRRRTNHVRNRHQPQSSITATTSISTPSAAAATDISSGSRSIHSRRAPEASTSSTATRSTRADSGSNSELSAAARLRPPPRRKLMTETSISSTATRSTRADSASTTDLLLSAAAPRLPRPPPRRRLTTEEKLSEIDAFLSSPDGEGRKGWI